MSYYRIYPTKSNTLIRYVGKPISQNINTGKSLFYHLMDGNAESKIVFSFQFPEWLETKIQNNSFITKFQLFDAGIIQNNPAKLKNIVLSSFVEDFIEGDGDSYLINNGLNEVSNWNKRDSLNDWNITFNHLQTYHLNNWNEDLNFEITNGIINNLNASLNYINLALNYELHENDNYIFSKSFNSKYAFNIFTPYLEFFINDEVLDDSLNFIAGKDNNVFLLNQNKQDFNGLLECFFVNHDGTLASLNVTNKRNGVYYTTIKTNPMINQGLMDILWKLNGVAIKSQKIKVIASENLELNDYSDIFYYPTTNSTDNVVLKGDIIPFTVISEIRGKGKIILKGYEYRVVTKDGFEICPWMPCSVYNGKIYFNLNTEYYFPETNYEVFLRIKYDENIITSQLSYKFKVKMNEKSFMNSQLSNPYYSRSQTFNK